MTFTLFRLLPVRIDTGMVTATPKSLERSIREADESDVWKD